MNVEPFILDDVDNPHPKMLTGALTAQREGGLYWWGYLNAMAAATGCTYQELLDWLERHR